MANKPTSEIGAPAALRAIEQHELRCRTEKETARIAWDSARAQKVDGDDVSERIERRAHNDYRDALEMWDDATKKLAVYDKQIAPEKREGVKISQAEAERYLTQAWRFQRLGRETFIVMMARDALTVKDEAEFYERYAEAIRDCEIESLKLAIAHEKFPEWVADCYDQSL